MEIKKIFTLRVTSSHIFAALRLEGCPGSALLALGVICMATVVCADTVTTFEPGATGIRRRTL